MPRGRPKKVAQAVKMPAEVAAPAEKYTKCLILSKNLFEKGF